MQCDFCGSPHIQHSYNADSFIMTEMYAGSQHVSVGGWAACEDCATLIDAGKWDVLIERVLDSQSLSGLERYAISKILTRVYETLRESNFRKVR